jgi:hypothetical protein
LVVLAIDSMQEIPEVISSVLHDLAREFPSGS